MNTILWITMSIGWVLVCIGIYSTISGMMQVDREFRETQRKVWQKRMESIMYKYNNWRK